MKHPIYRMLHKEFSPLKALNQPRVSFVAAGRRFRQSHFYSFDHLNGVVETELCATLGKDRVGVCAANLQQSAGKANELAASRVDRAVPRF
jgi:hypothetical protein